jgi:hypothetical protein
MPWRAHATKKYHVLGGKSVNTATILHLPCITRITMPTTITPGATFSFSDLKSAVDSVGRPDITGGHVDFAHMQGHGFSETS